MHRHGLFQLKASVPSSHETLHRIVSSPTSRDSLETQMLQVFARVQAPADFWAQQRFLLFERAFITDDIRSERHS